MALVAIGLVLICYRLLRGKSGAWLINANMLAALLVLPPARLRRSRRGSAAAWNVRHAREVGGRGVELDLCYLNELGPSALLPLLELETRPDLPAELRDRVAVAARAGPWTGSRETQADWHGWTLRGAAPPRRRPGDRRRAPPARAPAAAIASATAANMSAPAAPPPEEMPPAPQVNVPLPEENATAAPLTANAAR